MKTIDLNELTPYFPWGDMYADLGFAMPYPEVMMTSDRAYALQTQVSGLLMMQSWAAGNMAAYELRMEESTHEAYTLEMQLELPSIDDAWEVIGITEERLVAYMRRAFVHYVQATALSSRPFRFVKLTDERYLCVSE